MRDLFGFGVAAQRQRTAEFLVAFAPLRFHAFGFGGAGGDAVDPDPARAELGRPGADERFHRFDVRQVSLDEAHVPRCSSRPVLMTEAPSRASSSAHARPMPAVPPVINAVCSANSIESSEVYATCASAMRSRCRPRDARDMTVPCGMPRIAAVSA